MKQFKILFLNGSNLTVTARRFEMWTENSATFYDENNEQSAFYPNIAGIERVDTKPCSPDLSVIGTSGAPAAAPVSTVSETGVVSTQSVGSPS